MVTVSASTAGTPTNPIISRSYLEGAYAEALRAEISASLGRAMDSALSELDEIYKTYVGYDFAPRFIRVSLEVGETVQLSTGGSFILLSGAAELTVTGGTVINVSVGSEVPSGTQLTLNHRYFCVESTTAIVTASTATVGHVDGFYLTDGTVAAPPPPLPFTDVAATDWFYNAVRFVSSNSLFQGTTATTFSPGTSMTRAMFVTVLHRLDGLPAAGAGGGFADVSDRSLYYYDAVTWANENRIVEGYADGTFRPDTSISREQMATIMYRYARYKDKDLSFSDTEFDAFPDSGSVSDFAIEPLKWAVTWGVIGGSDGRLLPHNTASRAQVAQIIFNYCERVGR